jgi:small subunit ribosomal protein S6
MAADKRYESTFIVDGNLQDDVIETIIGRATDILTKNGGNILEVENWGRRKLAYMIEKVTTGVYISLHFTAPAAAIAKLDRHYQLDEQIIRWMTLVMPEENIKGRNAMKKRVEDVAARRALDAKNAEAAEAAAQAEANRANAPVDAE